MKRKPTSFAEDAKYKTYAMFLPPGDESRYVPLKVGAWEVKFKLDKTGEFFSEVSKNQHPALGKAVKFVDTLEPPVWTKGVYTNPQLAPVPSVKETKFKIPEDRKKSASMAAVFFRTDQNSIS